MSSLGYNESNSFLCDGCADIVQNFVLSSFGSSYYSEI